MAITRETGIAAGQHTLVERAAAVTLEQINAAMWALGQSEVSTRAQDAPEIVGAVIQAMATNYHAEALRSKVVK